MRFCHRGVGVCAHLLWTVRLTCQTAGGEEVCRPPQQTVPETELLWDPSPFLALLESPGLLLLTDSHIPRRGKTGLPALCPLSETRFHVRNKGRMVSKQLLFLVSFWGA